MRRNWIKNIKSLSCFFVNIHVLVFWLETIGNESLFLLFLEHYKLLLVFLVAKVKTMHQNISIFWNIVYVYLLHLSFKTWTSIITYQGIRETFESVVRVFSETLVLNFGIDVIFVTVDKLASLAIWTIPIRLIFLTHFGLIISTKIIFHHHLIFGMGKWTL